jgi:hypothetical protein
VPALDADGAARLAADAVPQLPPLRSVSRKVTIV